MSEEPVKPVMAPPRLAKRPSTSIISTTYRVSKGTNRCGYARSL